jgi:hypothetical protein
VAWLRKSSAALPDHSKTAGSFSTAIWPRRADMTNYKNKLVLGLTLSVIAFLAGFLPKWSELRRLQGDLESARKELLSCRFSGRLSHVRDLAGYVLVETSQKNYGLAGQHVLPLFGQLREIANETPNHNLKKSFEGILSRQEMLTLGLTNGDPAVLLEVQALFKRTHEATLNY